MQSLTGQLTFLTPTTRIRMGFTFSASTVTPEGEKGITVLYQLSNGTMVIIQ